MLIEIRVVGSNCSDGDGGESDEAFEVKSKGGGDFSVVYY